jgi:hypothetical protein
LFNEIKEIYNPIEPWGLISSKFSFKSHISIEEFEKFASTEIYINADCVFINPMIINESLFFNVWEQGKLGHEGLEEIKNHLAEKGYLNKNDFMGVNSFAFCNYFIGNNLFWSNYFEYINTVLAELNLESFKGTDIGKIYSGSANYHKNKSMTMRPFLIERLFSSFVNHESSKKLRFKTINIEKHHYQKKCGDNYGELLYNISKLKQQGESNQNQLQAWQDIRKYIISNNSILFSLLILDDPDANLMSISKKISSILK